PSDRDRCAGGPGPAPRRGVALVTLAGGRGAPRQAPGASSGRHRPPDAPEAHTRAALPCRPRCPDCPEGGGHPALTGGRWRVMTDVLDQAAKAIKRSSVVALACHVTPDGDALGSMLAMHHLCRAQGKPSLASWPE